MQQDVQQILLIRLSAIGDIVMASGLPSSTKRSYSHNGAPIEFAWLVEGPYVSLVRNHPYIVHVITWPKNEWPILLKAKKYWQTFIHSVRKHCNLPITNLVGPEDASKAVYKSLV